MVAANTTGLSLRGITYALIGGPPECAMKLVKPEVTVSNPPNHSGGGGLFVLGGNNSLCAKNRSVKIPTIPETSFASKTLKRKAPNAMPSNPNGSRNVSSFLSKSLRNAAILRTSITNSTGIKIAAACGTVITIAIMGTAKEPKPAPNPLLLIPSNSTAGIVQA